MSDATPSDPGLAPPSTPPARRRLSVRSLMILVALAGVLLWAGLEVRDQSRPVMGRLRALRSADPDERRDASWALLGLNPADRRRAVPALVEALGDADEATNLNILLALGEAGIAVAQDPAGRPEARIAAAAIARALGDPRELIRTQAARIMGEYARLPVADDGPTYDVPVAADALAGIALDDPALTARLAAASSLLAVAGIGAAARGADVPRPDVRPPAALTAALAALDRPGDVRGVAAALLGAFAGGHQAALPILAGALKDADPKVRRAAAVGLAFFEPGEARAALPALIPVLAEPLGDPTTYRSPTLAITAARLEYRYLSGGVDDLSLPQSAGNFVEPYITWDPAVMAAQAVGRIAAGRPTDEDALAALAGMLVADQSWRRQAAAATLKQVGRPATSIIPALIEALLVASPEPMLATPHPLGSTSAANLIEALARTAPGTPHAAAAVAALTTALASPSWETVQAAVAVLPGFGPAGRAALPALRAVAQGPNKDLAARAARAIAAIEPPPK